MNIFSALLEVTVYSAVLFALVLLLKRIFQKRFSPSLQYFVWFLLLARLAVPFTVESGIGFFTLPQSTFSVAAASASGDELSGSTASARPERMESMQAPQTETISHTAPASAAAAATESADADEPSGDAEAPSTQTAPSSAAAPPVRPGVILFAVWLSGIAVLTIKTVKDHISLSLRLKHASVLPPPEVRRMVDQVRRELGIKRRLRVLMQDSFPSPALTTSLNPTLLLPLSLLNAPAQMYFSIRHELVHFKRCDYLVCLLMLVLRAVYWFNPVVWLMQRPIKTDMEAACDNIATAALSQEKKKAYAHTILKMFAGHNRPQPVLGMSVPANRKTAERRIRSIFAGRRTGRGSKVLCIAAAVLFAAVCFTTACQPAAEVYPGITDRDRFAEGTLVAGVNVGGMTFDEGKNAVHPVAEGLLEHNIEYTVKGIDTPYTHSLASLGVSLDLDSALAHAMKNGGDGRNFPIETSVDDGMLEAAVARDSDGWNQPEASYSVETARSEEALTTSGKIVANTPETFFRVDQEALVEQIRKQIERGAYEPFFAPGRTQQAAPAAGQEPVLMGTFSTAYRSSDYGRRYNIWKMADIINGVEILPGETWSINEAAGPRTYSRGWKGAPGISNGEYKEEAGGGICQVSSTLYGAVLRSEIEVVDRSHHSWPLEYVPGGLDATISTDAPDFIIRNNYDVPVYIVATCDGQNEATIQVDIYGPGFEDGLRREFTSELIGTFGGGKVQYIDDPSLPAGTEQTIIKEHTGKKYQTYKHYYDAEGNLVKTEKFSIETYDNKPAKIRRGTGAAAPTPAPTPEMPMTPEPTPAPSATHGTQASEEQTPVPAPVLPPSPSVSE